jgi:hypothetical protein
MDATIKTARMVESFFIFSSKEDIDFSSLFLTEVKQGLII